MASGKKILHLILLIQLFWMGCVKDPQDIPGGATSDPVFGMTAAFDGQALNIEAGKDGWTMQPQVVDVDSIIYYSAIFSIDGCINQCAPSWEFRFYQVQGASGTAGSAFFQTIASGSKEFVPSIEERDSFDINLYTHPDLFMSGYSYWENLNTSSTTELVEYKDVIGYHEPLDVCFQSLAFTGCQYNQCIHFDPATLVPCITSIQARLELPNYVSLLVKPEGTAPFQFEWFDGSTSPSLVIRLQSDTADIYAGVKVTDANGNSSELNQTIRVQDGIVDACFFPIALTSTPVQAISPGYKSGRVEIIYTDQNGAEWSSTSGIQPQGSSLTIGDINYFGLSPLDQSTYKVKLSTSVKLFNEATGESKQFVTQETTIALSHR